MEKEINKIRIAVIGSGNVATYFAQKWFEADIPIIQIFSKTLQNAQKLAKLINAVATEDLQKIHPDVNLILIAVKDDAIEKVVAALPQHFAGIVVHTSGAVGVDVLKQKFNQYGIIYPLQSFTKGQQVVNVKFPILIDANQVKTKTVLEKMGQLISDNVHFLTIGQKQHLHLAAVFANNFSNHMFAISEDICLQNNLDFELLRPLIGETIQKLQNMSPTKAQTGPAIRKDQKTIDQHLILLRSHPQWTLIYEMLTQDIQLLHNS